MKTFFDTSVLVPAMVDQLSTHERSFSTFREYTRDGHEGFCSTHVLAECYSVLTALPLRRRISPLDAQQLIRENVSGRLTVIPLGPEEYFQAIERVSGNGLVSGIVYDSLHLIAAERAACERIYTFNVDHFRRIGAGSIAISAP
ncbi:MAG: type II toxin-antitoxin system VapC family toxin [Spirochaetaceae bacterium]|nr:MAG: type II toxin-antitoxin system VapC family toxin [Spirochaetaceae bacterium]